MKPDRFDGLDELLDEEGLDAYLQIDDATNSDMYYLAGFDAPDPFILLRKDGETTLLVSPLEYGRAEKEAEVDNVVNTMEYMTGDIRRSDEAQFLILDEFLTERNVEKVGVPDDFELQSARKLEDEGYSLSTVDDVVSEARRTKSEKEIEYIKKAQRANEKAMRSAENLLRSADVRNGVLYKDGEELTAEKVKTEIEIELIRNRCSLSETIVACGPKGADPHWRGEGPIEANQPIIIDIFPRHESKYHADMTRTFVKLEPSDEVVEMYETTVEAQEAAFEVLEEGAGVTGEEVHNAVCDVYEENGYPTLRQDDTEHGFIHSTGHGVGLDVHEAPGVSTGSEELKTGDVITVEPGLYNPEFGGVRVEDFVVVKEDGFENLTDYDKNIKLS